jgi:hypothetical protein
MVCHPWSRADNRSIGVQIGMHLNKTTSNNSGNHLTFQRSQITANEHAEKDEYGHSFICRTCPYEFIVDKEYYNRRMSRVKQVDDIMGGAAAWQNVDQTTGPLPVVLADDSSDVSE